MNLGADILTVRTGRATVMIGMPAALAAARGETARGETAFGGAAFGGPEASQLIDLALEACGETHGVRQFCIRSGFPSHGVAHVGNRGLRNWLVDAVRQGRLAVVLLPEVLFDAGAVQARTIEVRTDFALRIERVAQSQAGAPLRPLDLIESMQAGADHLGHRPAGGQTTGGKGRDLTPSDLRAMALEDRILEVIRRTLVALEASANVRRQYLEALVAHNRLAGTVAVLTAWADSHMGDVRALTDLALRAFGQGGLDEEIMSGLEALSQALACTRDALDPGGLEKAANRLARALTFLGPALAHLIACSTTLPVAVPVKSRAPSFAHPPTRPPPERYWPRPAPKTPAKPAADPPTLPSNVDAAARTEEQFEQRVKELSYNAEQKAIDIPQGQAAARYEQVVGRKVLLGNTEGVDLVDPDPTVGPLSVKGPLGVSKKGTPVTVTPKMVDGLAKSVVKDVQYNSATKSVVVDLSGLTADQQNKVIDSVADQLGEGPPKKITYIR